MIHRWQPLAIVAAVTLTVCAGTASAQTVIVKGAPAGSSAELILNGTAADSATADAGGLATMTVPESGAATASQAEDHVFVDRCGDVLRILLVEGPLAPPASAACARQALPGYFIVRRTTSFVIDVAGANATLLLTQGRVPQSWLLAGSGPISGSGEPLPAGLMVFGGAGLALGGNIGDVACGTGTTCTADTSRLSYGGGVAYWLTPFIALEGAYASPKNATATGSDTGLTFKSSLEARFVTISGLFGAPVGKGRIYGRVGGNRQRAVLNTTQTVADTTVVVGEDTITIPGASQTLELRTAGWGYVFGGGFEVWAAPRVAIYADLNRISINGKTEDASLRTIKDALWITQAGIRIRIGR